MKKRITQRGLALSLFLTVAGQAGFAQISGSVTVGSGGTYPTFTGTGGLFEAINTGGLNGNLSATVISDITEPGTTVLNQWVETPAASNFTFSITPADATEKIISGVSTAGLVTFNGADRVSINGSFAGAGKYLRFRNASTGSGASTITLTADAQNDTIANCIVEGSSITTSTTTAGAVIYMGPGTTSGNDNNAIIGNVVKNIDTAAGVPNFLLKSVNGATAALSSDNNFIYNNEFANFNSMGNFIGVVSGTNVGASGWIIRKNAYYQTAARTTALTGIQITTGFSHVVDSNNIGGSNASRAGVAIRSSVAPFYGVNITSTTTQSTAATAITVSANNISNIYLSASTGVIYGIYSTAYTKVLNNIIGSNNLASDTIRNAGTSNMGIMVTPAGAVGIANIITGNSIKNMKSSSTTNVMSAGINIQGGTYTIDNNVIDSISSGTGAVQTGGNALCGINIGTQSGTTNAISRNKISNLILTHSTAISCAAGILTQNALGSGALKIFGNKISKIMGVSTAGNVLTGIYANFTNAVSYDSIYNNMVLLGDGTTINSSVQGIVDASNASTTHTCANNTVVITGTTSAAASVSNAAYYRRNATTSSTLMNNIFINLRTITGTGTTGNNYTIYNAAAATTTSWKSAHNLLYNVDSAKLVYWQPSAAAFNFAGFKTIAVSDTNSQMVNIPFVDMANGDLHIDAATAAAWYVYGRGIAMSKIATDIDGNSRSTTIGTPTSVGAHEISMPTVAPADMEMTGTPTPGGVTTFSSGGRKIAEITWGTTVPTAFTSAKYYPGVAAPDQTMTGPNMNSYFELSVTPDVNTYDYTIKTYYTAAEGNGIADAAMVGIKKHGTDAYVATDAGSTSATDVSGKYLTSATLNNFSIFSITGNTTPLAINLKTITAKNTGNQNRIDWTTATEEKSDYFELESSTDASKFTKIATINAKGQASAYTYYDVNPAIGMNYYRLKMSIGNSRFVYSKTVNAEVKSLKSFELTAFPNPVKNKVSLQIAGTVQANATLSVVDATGRILKTMNVAGNAMEIDLSNFASGIFYIQYVDDVQSKTLKVLKD